MYFSQISKTAFKRCCSYFFLKEPETFREKIKRLISAVVNGTDFRLNVKGQKNNATHLLRVFSVLRKLGIAFRGHDESETSADRQLSRDVNHLEITMLT
jgi:hypothetical protein